MIFQESEDNSEERRKQLQEESDLQLAKEAFGMLSDDDDDVYCFVKYLFDLVICECLLMLKLTPYWQFY